MKVFIFTIQKCNNALKSVPAAINTSSRALSVILLPVSIGCVPRSLNFGKEAFTGQKRKSQPRLPDRRAFRVSGKYKHSGHSHKHIGLLKKVPNTGYLLDLKVGSLK